MTRRVQALPATGEVSHLHQLHARWSPTCRCPMSISSVRGRRRS